MAVLLLLYGLQGAEAWSAPVMVQWSPAEQAWLQSHPVLKLGIDPDYAPYEFVNEDKQYLGISKDYITLLSSRLGVEIRQQPFARWGDVMGAARNREIDLLSAVVKTPERAKFLQFTLPYIQNKAAIITQWDQYTVNAIADLSGERVALVRDYAFTELAMQLQPDIRPVYVDTVLEGLKAVENGDAVAMISDLGAMAYKIRQYKLTNLEFACLVDNMEIDGLAMAVRNDWPVLTGILNKALDSISDSEHQQILQRWIKVEPKVAITLSEAEKTFLEEHPVIHLGVDPEFAPFEYIDDAGEYQGITSDYIKILNKRLGIRMEVVKGLSWRQAVAGVKARELDLLPAVGVTEERKAFLNYSRPYVHFQRVIISRNDMPFLTGIDDIRGLRVAVQSSSSHEGFLKDNTDITAAGYKTLQGALTAVSEGKADAFIGNLASATHWIRKLNLTNLKVATLLSSEAEGLHFAVRKDWPELVTILNKGLASISERGHSRISEKWVVLKHDAIVDYTTVAKVALLFSLLVLLMVAWLLYVQRQRKALQLARDESECARLEAMETNRELTRLHDELEQIVREKTEEALTNEKKFQQAQKMEAVGTLVGGIAHDFNNMLAGMTGNLFLLEEYVGDNPEALAKLQTIEELAYRASEMVSQLLTFARKGHIELKEIDLGPFVKETMKFLRTTIPANIEVHQHIADEAMPVKGDATLLHQILMNLINNARDAVSESQAPEICIKLERFYEAEDIQVKGVKLHGGNYAHLCVEDNGCGIAGEYMQQLFEPFFTTKEVGEGTGLGLAMVFGAVKTHGGQVHVENKREGGATFHIYLPLTTAADKYQAAAEQVWQGHGETILVVDDEEVMRSTTAMILERIHYRVILASDGLEAIEVFNANREKISLIIMDVVMPRLGGVEAIRQIRQIKPEVKVIYATGYDKSEALNGLSLGSDKVCSKPYKVHELSQLIREQLDKA